MSLKKFIVRVVCLGCEYRIEGLYAHSFDAWNVAAELYPQADQIEVIDPTKGAKK